MKPKPIKKLFEIKEIPKENTTIYNYIDINLKEVLTMDLYVSFVSIENKRVVFITFTDEETVCIKMPEEMTKEEVLTFFKPLMDDLRKLKIESKNKLH